MNKPIHTHTHTHTQVRIDKQDSGRSSRKVVVPGEGCDVILQVGQQHPIVTRFAR